MSDSVASENNCVSKKRFGKSIILTLFKFDLWKSTKIDWVHQKPDLKLFWICCHIFKNCNNEAMKTHWAIPEPIQSENLFWLNIYTS